ncbi:L-ascorbate oxidase [Ephemerocybe angulata]|uniref:Peroxidase n=1 Tax=Ephemerocybe angulata TaxID=980116 RepID=A0A8H6IDY0_9AGAR|nr:L-ascorbate oxidase [Tulosesus angulatus]
MHSLPLGLLLLSSVAQLSSAAYTWPSPQYDALEGLLYEGRRPDGSSLAALVHPCRKRTQTLASVGAEWLRFAFHDSATHNVDDGTGGLDGSLVYELSRGENFGIGFTQTSADFELFPNKYISRADVIAIGAVHAVSTCGGPIIPFRGGRVDTFVAGGTGTPEPQQDIDTLTESFRKQGYTKEDMIKLVACGHTMGGVRSDDFPQLVPQVDGKAVIADFDTTMDFDNKIATEYLDGTTQNVLVKTDNVTMRADLRVFESDGNSTIRAMASADVFQSDCLDVLGRMLEKVPKGVSLTDEITLLPEKVTYAQFAIENGKLVYKTNLRLLQKLNTNPSASRVVTMFWCDRAGANKDCKGKTKSSVTVKKVPESPNISPVTLKLGYYLINYNFVVPIDANESIAKFWFEVDEGDGSKPTAYNNGGNNYVVDQDQVFFVPTLSKVDSISNNTGTVSRRGGGGGEPVGDFYKSYNLVVAVRDGTSPSRVYVDGYDSAVKAYAYAVQNTVDLQLDSSTTPIAGYKFYKGVFQSSGLQLTIDVKADADGQTYTQGFVGTAPLDNTVITDPGTINTDKMSTAGAISWREGWTFSLVFSLVAAAMFNWSPL